MIGTPLGGDVTQALQIGEPKVNSCQWGPAGRAGWRGLGGQQLWQKPSEMTLAALRGSRSPGRVLLSKYCTTTST